MKEWLFFLMGLALIYFVILYAPRCGSDDSKITIGSMLVGGCN